MHSGGRADSGNYSPGGEDAHAGYAAGDQCDGYGSAYQSGTCPISREHMARLAEVACGYSNLEYDLEAGRRGERYSHFEKLLCRITGAEVPWR